MYEIWHEELVADCEIGFSDTWCPTNKLALYRVIILSAQISGTAITAVSFSGVGVILNNNESNKMYHSANVSTFLIAALELGN